MGIRERAFALVLLISGTLITIGVGLVSVPAAMVVAGVALAVWAWLVLSD